MPRLVCFGDSITQGSIGTAYVAKIAHAMPHVDVLNRGIDGDTTFNLLQRVETDVIDTHPDVVSIMIGLNDFGTAIDISVFEALYAALIERLQRAQIAVVLFTPTTLGELPDTPGQALLDGYVAAVYRLAHQYHVPIVDVRAAFVQAMRARPFAGPVYHLWRVPLDNIAIRAGSTYEHIAHRRGFQLLVDGVHLSDAGAALVANTVLPTLHQLLPTDGRLPAAEEN
jgi:lysophospholipase L1-like esterase